MSACPASSTLVATNCIDFSTALINPKYLIKGLSSKIFGESEIKGLGLSVSGFLGNNGELDTKAMTT